MVDPDVNCCVTVRFDAEGDVSLKQREDIWTTFTGQRGSAGEMFDISLQYRGSGLAVTFLLQQRRAPMSLTGLRKKGNLTGQTGSVGRRCHLSPLLFPSLDVAYLTHKMALYPSEDGKQEKQPVQTDLWGKVSEQKKLWVCCFRGLGYLCRPSGPSETSSRLFKHFVFPSCLHSPTSRGSGPTLCRTLCRPVPTSDWFRWDGGSTATGSLS